MTRAYGTKTMIHTCGSSSWAYEDFIAMGIDAVDTLQPEVANMICGRNISSKPSLASWKTGHAPFANHDGKLAL